MAFPGKTVSFEGWGGDHPAPLTTRRLGLQARPLPSTAAAAGHRFAGLTCRF